MPHNPADRKTGGSFFSNRHLTFGPMVLAAFFLMAVTARAEVAVIPVDYARADDLMPAIEMLLTDTGKASFDRRTHSLVVVDTPEAVAGIRSLLEKFDLPVPQLTIRVRFEEIEKRSDRGVFATGRVGGSGGSVGTPGSGANRIDATVSDTRRTGRTVSEQILRVASGSAAFIAVGRDIPYTQRWAAVCRRHAACGEITAFQRVDTGFDVVPSVRGDRVQLQITPRLGAVAAGPAGSARFVRAATEVSVTPGQWVDLGAMVASGNEVFSEILGRGAGSSNKEVNIRLKVETVQ